MLQPVPPGRYVHDNLRSLEKIRKLCKKLTLLPGSNIKTEKRRKSSRKRTILSDRKKFRQKTAVFLVLIYLPGKNRCKKSLWQCWSRIHIIVSWASLTPNWSSYLTKIWEHVSCDLSISTCISSFGIYPQYHEL